VGTPSSSDDRDLKCTRTIEIESSEGIALYQYILGNSRNLLFSSSAEIPDASASNLLRVNTISASAARDVLVSPSVFSIPKNHVLLLVKDSMEEEEFPQSCPMNFFVHEQGKFFSDLSQSVAKESNIETIRISLDDMKTAVEQMANAVTKISQLVPRTEESSSSITQIVIDGLLNLRTRYGSDSAEYNASVKKIREFLDEISKLRSSQLSTSYVVFFDTSKSRFKPSLALLSQASAAPSTTNNTNCFLDVNTCNNSTQSCTGRGTCQKIRGSQCFRCVCRYVNNTYYGGNRCQYIDLSTDLLLILGTSFFMLLVIIGATASLIRISPLATSTSPSGSGGIKYD